MKTAKLHWDSILNGDLLNLGEGDLCFPDLNWDGPLDVISPSLRLSKSIRGICTNLRGNGFREIANTFAEQKTIDNLTNKEISERHLDLGKTIQERIQSIVGRGEYSEGEMREVFHLIQLWGGNAARNIYLMDGGFEKNWSYRSYREIAQKCLRAEPSSFRRTIKELNESSKQINQWGLAFASKHYSFWNGAGADPYLTIFDSVLCRGLFGKKTPSLKLYERYLWELIQSTRALGVSIQNVERKLFNYFQSDEGVIWIAVRMRSSESE
jgi:hypothetical protein